MGRGTGVDNRGSTTLTHRDLVLFPVSLASRDQDVSLLNSVTMIDTYDPAK